MTRIASSVSVTVRGKSIDLPQRVLDIVRYLVEEHQKISDPRSIQVTFDCSGKSVKAEIKERIQVT